MENPIYPSFDRLDLVALNHAHTVPRKQNRMRGTFPPVSFRLHVFGVYGYDIGVLSVGRNPNDDQETPVTQRYFNFCSPGMRRKMRFSQCGPRPFITPLPFYQGMTR